MKNDNQIKTTELLRINSIVDMPSSIEDIFHLRQEKILALRRSNSIELWSTNIWIQILKLPGLKSNTISLIWLFINNLGNEIKKVFMIKSKKSENPLEYLRIFSISLNGSLLEWCLHKLSPKVI